MDLQDDCMEDTAEVMTKLKASEAARISVLTLFTADQV